MWTEEEIYVVSTENWNSKSKALKIGNEVH